MDKVVFTYFDEVLGCSALMTGNKARRNQTEASMRTSIPTGMCALTPDGSAAAGRCLVFPPLVQLLGNFVTGDASTCLPQQPSSHHVVA